MKADPLKYERRRLSFNWLRSGCTSCGKRSCLGHRRGCVFNFKASVAAATLTTAQKAAALGYAQVIEAEMLFEVVQTHDSLGAIVEIRDNASDLAPFVSRDSVYKYILGTLDAAINSLNAGGASFPFTLHSGYAGFNTPTTHARYAQAIKAKVAAHYATAGGGATAWQSSLTALNEKDLPLLFLNHWLPNAEHPILHS